MKNSSHTLLELIATLLLISILALLIIKPFLKIRCYYGQEKLRHQLNFGLRLSRLLSLKNEETILFCPYSKKHCGQDWRKGFQIRTQKEQLYFSKFKSTCGKVQFNRDNIIRFSSTGKTSHNGQFVFYGCDNSTSKKLLIFNVAGRVRQDYLNSASLQL